MDILYPATNSQSPPPTKNNKAIWWSIQLEFYHNIILSSIPKSRKN